VSRKEIEEYWTINDVFDANVVLDLKEELEELALKGTDGR
jgi:hypothetical protein